MKKLLLLYLIVVIAGYFYYNNTRKITIVSEVNESPEIAEDISVQDCPTIEQEEKTVWEAEFTVTAYNTVPDQTDSSPCITASGENICGKTHTVACSRFFEFGTEFAIDNEVYRCNDRFNYRYDDVDSKYFDPYKLDINFDKDVSGAIEYGIRKKIVKIIEVKL